MLMIRSEVKEFENNHVRGSTKLRVNSFKRIKLISGESEIKMREGTENQF